MTDERDDRCTQEMPIPGTAAKLKCSDSGHWTFDRRDRTWRPANPTDRSRKCWAHGPGSGTKRFGPRGHKIHPNAQTQRFIVQLFALGPEITRALNAVNDELSLLGFPSSGGGGTGTCEGEATDPVAGDVTRIVTLTEWRENLRDAITAMGHAVDRTTRLVAQQRVMPPVLMSTRGRKPTAAEIESGDATVAGIKLCGYNQQGRQGSADWGDAACTELPVRRGLCASCTERERRWRKAEGLSELTAPAA